MIDETQQLYNLATAEAAAQNSQGEAADVTQRRVRIAPIHPEQQFPSVESAEPSAKPIFIVAAIVIVFGLVAGVLFATVLSHPATSQTGPRDLPPLISTADGLKGQLTLHWDGKLQYRLVVEPSDPAQKPEFSATVSNPPRPLSVSIQLKDSAGTPLCGKTVLLNFPPGQAAGKKARASDSTASGTSQAQAQDVFQNDLGRDGQSESISVLGQLPCTMQAYARTTAWSLSPDFLTLDQQAALLKRQQDLLARANAAPDESADKAYAARRKARNKQPEQFGSFAMEGDDELVGYDPSRGLIQTSARKTFVIEKVSGDGNAARWGDVPANVHYKCDMNDACTLTRSGAALLYARLNR